jgi:hypothetical protein
MNIAKSEVNELLDRDSCGTPIVSSMKGDVKGQSFTYDRRRRVGRDGATAWQIVPRLHRTVPPRQTTAHIGLEVSFLKAPATECANYLGDKRSRSLQPKSVPEVPRKRENSLPLGQIEIGISIRKRTLRYAERLAEDYLGFIPILLIIARCSSVQSPVVLACWASSSLSSYIFFVVWKNFRLLCRPDRSHF